MDPIVRGATDMVVALQSDVGYSIAHQVAMSVAQGEVRSGCQVVLVLGRTMHDASFPTSWSLTNAFGLYGDAAPTQLGNFSSVAYGPFFFDATPTASTTLSTALGNETAGATQTAVQAKADPAFSRDAAITVGVLIGSFVAIFTIVLIVVLRKSKERKSMLNTSEAATPLNSPKSELPDGENRRRLNQNPDLLHFGQGDPLPSERMPGAQEILGRPGRV